MNRAVLGAGHGLTVTLEIRHSVIPGGFVRACARREHPPSSASHFPATIISGCHDRPARAFLLRISSRPLIPPRDVRPSWMSPRPLSRRRLNVSARARESMPEAIYHTRYFAHRCKYCRLLRRARATTHYSYSLVFLYLRPAFFPRPRDKETGEPSLVNFGRNSTHFDSHAILARKRPAFRTAATTT